MVVLELETIMPMRRIGAALRKVIAHARPGAGDRPVRGARL